MKKFFAAWRWQKKWINRFVTRNRHGSRVDRRMEWAAEDWCPEWYNKTR